jgi:3-oxoacyl-[acyl-carrier protein] reductase
MSNLKNKNIIVTGASGGIGGAIIEKLHNEGANVLATGTKTKEKALKELRYYNLIYPNMKKLKNLSIMLPNNWVGHLIV